MRSYAALIATVLLLSGCSGFGKFFDDTVTLPGDNPEAPKGDSENMQRVRGYEVSSEPILPQGGNIWPSRPPALPTLSDVANDEKGFSLSDYGRASGADVEVVTHEQGREKHIPSDFPEDGDLKAGETEQIRNGVTNFGNGTLPDNIEDNAPQYIQKSDNKSVVIDNGNGTSKVISPFGIVTTVPNSKVSEAVKNNDTTAAEKAIVKKPNNKTND